ncbi:MAG: WD40 repeat domain-containing protein, partial [Pseudomonadota bacterium]
LGQLWDLATGQPALAFPGDSQCLAVATNGKTVLARRRADRSLWQSLWIGDLGDLGGGQTKELDVSADLAPAVFPPRPAAFSPDGTRFGVVAASGLAWIQDLTTGKRLLLAGHRDGGASLAFSPDSKYVATASYDTTVRVWEVASGRPCWRTTALVGSPPKLRSQVGWIAFDQLAASALATSAAAATASTPSATTASGSAATVPLGAPAAGESAWQRAIASRAESASSIGSSQLLCLCSTKGSLELWDRASDGLLGTWRILSTEDAYARDSSTRDSSGGTAPPQDTAGQALAAGSRLRAAAYSRRADLWPVPAGCLVLADGRAQLYHRAGATTGVIPLADNARVVGAGDSILLVGSDDRIAVFVGPTESGQRQSAATLAALVTTTFSANSAGSATGVPPASATAVAATATDAPASRSTDHTDHTDHIAAIAANPGSPVVPIAVFPGSRKGLTAIGASSGYLILGTREGQLEALPLSPSSTRPRLALRGGPAGEVVRIAAGPKGTVLAGYASGFLGLWSLESGAILGSFKLHGPVSHLLLAGHQLYAATELGDYQVIDLVPFYQDHCELLASIWARVPVVWEHGMPVLAPPPSGHRCRR